jgi:hypothetical protein
LGWGGSSRPSRESDIAAYLGMRRDFVEASRGPTQMLGIKRPSVCQRPLGSA